MTVRDMRSNCAQNSNAEINPGMSRMFHTLGIYPRDGHFLITMCRMYTRDDTPFGIKPGVKKGEISAQHTPTIGIIGRKSLGTSDHLIVLPCTPEGSKREKHTNLHTFEDLRCTETSHPWVFTVVSLVDLRTPLHTAAPLTSTVSQDDVGPPREARGYIPG